MTEEKTGGILKEAGEGLKAILERIADFFDIFDPSFVVSGATSLAALAFWASRARITIPVIAPQWVFGVALIIACYVMGLICFALGRWSRMGWRQRKSVEALDRRFRSVLDGHGLSAEEPFAAYLARPEARGIWRLYVRMWAEIRHSPAAAPSFYLLRRYWVMAATYDGLAPALCLWAVICLLCGFGVFGVMPIDKWLGISLAGALALAGLACNREAGRYVFYQVEELIASVAAVRAGHLH